ncbi:MAG: hypothetical protein FWD54_07275 [Endomicrobia bacterium]|nr:hypothetical protein [Endomicrobiia bacterium]MCL2800054.1 hypothetical protein [Endomicrobiia bacterium]
MKKILLLLTLLSVSRFAYAENFADKYNSFKENLKEKTGFSYGADISFTAQRIEPEGGETAVQQFYHPYVSYTPFENTAWGQRNF